MTNISVIMPSGTILLLHQELRQFTGQHFVDEWLVGSCRLGAPVLIELVDFSLSKTAGLGILFLDGADNDRIGQPGFNMWLMNSFTGAT
jgi:hypothetical protein